MAVEKFIRGKVDEAHHVGRAGNTRRLQEAEHKLAVYEQDMAPGVDYSVTNMQRHQDNLSRLHGFYYKGTYFHHGVGQKRKEIL